MLGIPGKPAAPLRSPLQRLLGSPGSGGGGGKGRGFSRAATGGSGDGEGSGARKGLWAKYLELLDSQPMLTRSVTCALLNGLGDILSQLLIEQSSSLDSKRTLTFTALGMFFVGPILTTWYGLLGSMVTAPGTKGVIISLLLDQVAFAPAFIASFMSVLTTIDGKPENIMPKLRQDWPEAVKVNWLLWVPAQFINFKFVPPNLRVLAVNVVALVWNCYMSFQSHKAVVHAPKA